MKIKPSLVEETIRLNSCYSLLPRPATALLVSPEFR
jgi:hypothetical protein